MMVFLCSNSGSFSFAAVWPPAEPAPTHTKRYISRSFLPDLRVQASTRARMSAERALRMPSCSLQPMQTPAGA